MRPYTISLLALDRRHCIVVGGGHSAEQKVDALLAVEATVTLISPTLTPRLQSLADEARFTWLKREYRYGDLRGAFMVIAEPSLAGRNAAISAEAEQERALYTVIGDVKNCNFV